MKRSASAVMVEGGAVDKAFITLGSGVAVLPNCTLKDNPVEAVVAQGNSPTGILATPVISLEKTFNAAMRLPLAS